MFGRQPRHPARQLTEDRLPRRREPADLGRVHPDEQLQIGAGGEVLARPHQPFQHVRKRVGGIVELRVPRHVGEQSDHRLRRVEADARGELLRVVLARAVEHDPVEQPLAPARQVLHQLALLLLRQHQVLPVRARLGHERVVVGVVVAEDEAPLPVGHVPRGHPHALAARHLADEPPGHVDAVGEDGGDEADAAQQARGGRRGEERRLEVAPQHRLAVRLGVERSGREEAQRAGVGVLADRHPVAHVAGNRLARHRRRQLPRRVPVVRVEPVAVAVDRQTERAVDALGRPQTVGAEIGLRPAAHERRHVRVQRRFALGARRQRRVAQQRVHLGAAERERRRERALERHRVGVGADGRGHQHPLAARGGPPRSLPQRRFRLENRFPVRVGVVPGVIPAPEQPRRPPQRGDAADAALHAGARSGSRSRRSTSMSHMKASGAGSSSKRRHGRWARSSSTE